MRDFFFFFNFFAKIQRLQEALSMTHFLYLKCSEKVIWIYNILLIEKPGQQFIQGLVSLCPQVSRISGKRLSSARSGLKRKHPKRPMTKTEHISSFFPKWTSQVDLLTKIWSTPSDTPRSDILKLMDWWFDRGDWLPIIKMINGCGPGHSQSAAVPSHRCKGKSGSEAVSTPPGGLPLGGTSYRRGASLWDGWK